MDMESKYSLMETSIQGIMNMASLMEKEDINGMRVDITKECFSKDFGKEKANG